MEPERAITSGLRASLDGYDIGRGFGRACPSCEREYEPGDRLLVTSEREPDAAGWRVESIVCVGCDRRTLGETASGSREQALVSVELAGTGMTLALDGETARLLDRAPEDE